MGRLLVVLIFVGFVLPSSSTDSTLTTFLVEANQQLAGIYDQVVLAQLQNVLRGSNDIVALLEMEIADEKLLNYLKSLMPHLASQVQAFEVGGCQPEEAAEEDTEAGLRCLGWHGARSSLCARLQHERQLPQCPKLRL
ncbi:uncharacterized protein [Drosophila pseudoobscura]|uniref:Uncharacterized protein n=1 Tax=Drosophila pseudoobscura pseudoobscura TaxID=46245 RepID=A0A6I8VY85_DROPS|nr:uncharacterized protein LOC26534307 [Drosophila pseudoobscura]